VSAVVAGAQSASPTSPQLVVSGRGKVEVTPDRAELILSVETRALTGSEAGRLNAQIVAAVLDTLRRGFLLTDKDLTTAGYMLRPEMSYPPSGGPPRVEGYVAMN